MTRMGDGHSEARADNPLDMPLRPARVSWVALAFATLGALLALYVALLELGVHGVQLFGLNLANVVEFGATALVVARVIKRRDGRRTWAPAAVGMVCYSLGFIVYAEVVERHHPIAYPSVSDALWLSIHPSLYVTIRLLARGRPGERDEGLWLDGLVAALAVSALGSALFFEPVLRTATGGATSVATNLAYPFSDVTLLAFVAAALSVTGARPIRTWLLVSGGLAIFAVSDSVYVTLA